MKITLVRDDGKVNTLRTLKIELLLEQMKTEVKAQPVSKMREALRYTLPGNSIEGVRKVPKVIPAAAFVRKEGVMTLNEYNGIVMMEVNNLSGRAEADEIKELVKELPQTYLAFTGSSGKSVKIWVRFTYSDDRLPTLREQAELFHAHAYQTAVKYYQPQLPFDIELKEPEWKPEENKKIEPSKVIHKDPQITNTGTNDAFVYMEVSIPMANVEAAAENGERLGKKVQELFSFEAKDSWTQLSVQNAESRRTYTYAYKKILKPQETSETLFDTVKFLNLIEGQLDGQTLEIPVRAYAIQTSYTGGSSDNLPEQIKAAYEKYVNQNKNQDGKVTE